MAYKSANSSFGDGGDGHLLNAHVHVPVPAESLHDFFGTSFWWSMVVTIGRLLSLSSRWLATVFMVAAEVCYPGFLMDGLLVYFDLCGKKYFYFDTTKENPPTFWFGWS